MGQHLTAGTGKYGAVHEEEDALQYIMQLVATPLQRLLLLILPPSLCSGTHYSISVSHGSGTCSVYVSVVEFYLHTNIYTC